MTGQERDMMVLMQRSNTMMVRMQAMLAANQVCIAKGLILKYHEVDFDDLILQYDCSLSSIRQASDF